MKNSPFHQNIIFKCSGVRYKRHPVYDMYASSKCGKMINIKRQNPFVGNLKISRCSKSKVRRSNDVQKKLINRIVLQCHHGIIPDNYVVDHKNDNKMDNRLKNLQLLTSQQNTNKIKNISDPKNAKQSILQPIKSHSM